MLQTTAVQFLRCKRCEALRFDLQLPIGLQGPRTAQTFAEMVKQAWQTQAASIKVPSQLLVAFQMTL